MQGANSKNEYILASSPVQATARYFWRMVYEMNVNVIVMLDANDEIIAVCRHLVTSFAISVLKSIYLKDFFDSTINIGVALIYPGSPTLQTPKS